MPVNFSQDQIKATGGGNRESDEKENKPFLKKADDFLLKLSRVPLKEKLFFVQHLGVMLKSGISLSVAIKTLSKQTENKLFKAVLADIAEQVEKGKSFTESLSGHKKIFGELFVSMVEAGELSGKLEDVLAQLYLQMKKEHKLISKVKGALTYPVVILFAMFGIGTFMLIFVVPKITSMFSEMNAELPLPTKILIGLSDAIANNGLLSGALFITFVFSFLDRKSVV